MPRFGPVKRTDLIGYFRGLGFTGPYAGGRHEFMQRGGVSLTIPNPHGRISDQSCSGNSCSKQALTGGNGSGCEYPQSVALIGQLRNKANELR